MTDSHEELVRRLWDLFARGGIEPALELVGEDVEWVPYLAEGRVLRGSEELREYFRDRASRAEVIEAAPYSYTEVGENVVVSGQVRLRSPQGIQDAQLHWVYRFEGDRLLRAEGYPSREEAMRAAEADG